MIFFCLANFCICSYSFPLKIQRNFVTGNEATTSQHKEQFALQFNWMLCETHYFSDAASVNKQRKNSRYRLNKYYGRPYKRKSKLCNVTVDTTRLPSNNVGRYWLFFSPMN